MVYGKLLSYDNDLSEAFTIRRKVFIEEMGMSEAAVFDDLDKDSIHVVVYEEAIGGTQRAVASGRLLYKEEKSYIEYLAVLKDDRRKQYGDCAIKMLLNKAFTSGIYELYLKSGENTKEFFIKIGFQVIDHPFEKDQSTSFTMLIHKDDLKRKCKFN